MQKQAGCAAPVPCSVSLIPSPVQVLQLAVGCPHLGDVSQDAGILSLQAQAFCCS